MVNNDNFNLNLIGFHALISRNDIFYGDIPDVFNNKILKLKQEKRSRDQAKAKA
ncbi:MAG: hypothetical protein ACTSVI_03845 [Promethearchaeota archaeon]